VNAGFKVVSGLDLGLFSDNPAMPAFYQNEVGLPFIETLRHSPTYEERFYAVNDSALKINLSTEPMPVGHSGYRGLSIARGGITAPVELVDPDGLPVRLVAPGTNGITQYGITCEVADSATQANFLMVGLGAGQEPDGGLRLGNALIELVEVADARPASPTWSTGFNYIVAFVDDILAAHDGLVEYGASQSVSPTRLADRCVFSWLRDPSGNWLELVQPATLGLGLPDVTPIEQRWQEIISWRETGAVI
jgi:catechol 2,3-dioxygenase-like lactoylglutathione lyase family enzyme